MMPAGNQVDTGRTRGGKPEWGVRVPHGRETVRSRLGPCPNLLTLRPHANRSHHFLNLRSVRLCLLSFRVVTALVGERLLIPWFTPMVSSLDQAFTIPTAGSRVGSAHS